jgi:hypothetical protein
MGGEAFDGTGDQNDICNTCGMRRWWHEENQPRHEFTLDEAAIRLPQVPASTPGPPQMQSGDLVLRLALLKAGVITETNLTEAEVWVREAQRTGKALIVGDDGFVLESAEGLAREVGTHGG